MKNKNTGILELVNAMDLTSNPSADKKKTSNTAILFLTVFIMFLGQIVGCANQPTTTEVIKMPDAAPTIVSAESHVSSAKTATTEVKTTLTETTTSIETNATQGRAATPVAVQPVLNPFWNNILNATQTQRQLIEKLNFTEMELTAALADLSAAKTRVGELEEFAKGQTKRAIAAEEAKKKALAEKNSALRDKYIWISIVCFAGLVISLILLMMGNSWAQWTAIGCGIGVAGSIFLIEIIPFIPWIIGGILLIAGGVVVWQIIAKNKAIKEVVHTNEVAKTLLTEDKKQQVFGDPNNIIPSGYANSIQSNTTKKIVAETRKKIATNVALKKAPILSVTPSLNVQSSSTLNIQDSSLVKPVVIPGIE